MDAQPGCDIGKDSTGQKRQRTGQSNRPRFDTLPPDFRVRPAAMEPITAKEPISQRRYDTGANCNQGQVRPVHILSPLVSRHHACTSGSRSQQSSRRLIYTASSVGGCGYRRLEALYRSVYGLLFHHQITEELPTMSELNQLLSNARSGFACPSIRSRAECLV